VALEVAEERSEILGLDGFGRKSVDKVGDSGSSVKEVSFSESLDSMSQRFAMFNNAREGSSQFILGGIGSKNSDILAAMDSIQDFSGICEVIFSRSFVCSSGTIILQKVEDFGAGFFNFNTMMFFIVLSHVQSADDVINLFSFLGGFKDSGKVLMEKYQAE